MVPSEGVKSSTNSRFDRRIRTNFTLKRDGSQHFAPRVSRQRIGATGQQQSGTQNKKTAQKRHGDERRET
eukprot:scaffold2757_cov105-Pinguiococcus_pyrenoidosus.AAC.1